MCKIKPTLVRVALWFVSFLLADLCFSLFFGFYSLNISVSAACFIFTAIFALPAWCLFLPIVIAFKDAEERRIWGILSGGTLIGPLSLLLWDAAEWLHNVNSQGTWLWDSGVLPVSFLVCAVIVGFLTTCAYVYGLKILHGRRKRCRYFDLV